MAAALWRIAAWSAGLLPAAWLIWCVVTLRMGPNPVEFLEHQTGLWALRLLLATLAMTPLRRLLGRFEPIRVRRIVGLWTFAFATAHFGIYLWFDLSLSIPQLAEDLVLRSYITLGFLAWLLMLPLAITSTRGWQRRLKRRWVKLHRLIYASALLAPLHFLWLVKSDIREPAVYLGIALALLASRLPLGGILRAPQTLRSRRQG